MSRIFMSHSSRNSRQAVAVKGWLVEQEEGLADEIFLDLDPHTGIRPGEKWKEALKQANDRWEAVICLLSKHWMNSHECEAEFRYAENLGKTILCARLEPVLDTNITSEWQRCDLFPNHGPTTAVDGADGGQPVVLDTIGLQRLLDALRKLGIGAEHFRWPPPDDPDRTPYRGWAPLEEADAAVFFGRPDPGRAGCAARDAHQRGRVAIRHSWPVGDREVVVSASGAVPRLRRDDRRFLPLPIVRPERAVLTGEARGADRRTWLGARHP
jgi:TIR domain